MSRAFYETDRCVTPTQCSQRFKLRNDFYLVTLFYSNPDSDYETDKKNRALNSSFFSAKIKPKASNYNLTAIFGPDGVSVSIHDPELEYIDPQYLPDIVEKLWEAAESAGELIKALTPYLK